MSGRSFRLSALVVGAAACGKAAPPEADPAQLTALAQTIYRNVPAPGAAPECKREDLVGATLSQVTLAKLAHEPIADDPQHADWINPVALDSPAARVLVDGKADATAQRRAAAELLGGSGFTVYRIDIVNAPIALGVKELKIGTVGGRALHYDKTGAPTCVSLFTFQNDQAKSDWAIAQSDRAVIAPEVAKAMRDDLTAQYLAHAPRPAPPPK